MFILAIVAIATLVTVDELFIAFAMATIVHR